MPLLAPTLALELHNSLKTKTDAFGLPTLVSPETFYYAKGIVAAVTSAVVSHAPGTITGVTAPGAPLSGGSGIGGTMVITPAAMLAETAPGTHPQALPQVQAENSAIIQYIGTALINFAPGSITGTCTNTPTNPGPLTAGAGANGVLTGITGAGAAAAVASALGSVGPDMLDFYTALINYLILNTTASYAPGTVTGVCPPGGGPLTGGTAAGGTLA